ncbi:hypothetical protein J1N10_13045 [Carboxylicivirga sp. A043]|uniref:hypothetical protein n=1 Tax=Carboxylicivirga litoralis TaxID=2816963 RepID=UPI0021CB917E|nr:hypothetical protein [Carboxylicivirga sp. A043]MCU4156908.1 hypothetical protein [Carboxylicivirga sp. A043]
MDDLTIKTKLLEELNRIIDEKINTIKSSISDISDSMKNDTKSSAGDKFETGREMMQIELSKQQVQLKKQLQLKKDLELIKLNKSYTSIEFGSLVHTNKGLYLMAIAHGKVTIDSRDYYVLSMASPIGQQLKGKKTGDEINFNNQLIKVLDIQ